MADVILPANNRASQRFSVSVTGGDIGLGLRWSTLNEQWYITIDGVTRDRVIVSDELLGHAAGGSIWALSLHDDATDPQRYAWGDTHYLVWLEALV